MDYSIKASGLAVERFGEWFFRYREKSELQQALKIAQNISTFSILDVHLAPDDVWPALQRLSALFTKTLKG